MDEFTNETWVNPWANTSGGEFDSSPVMTGAGGDMDSNWQTWLQDISKQVVGTVSQIEVMKTQQRGEQTGLYYTPGYSGYAGAAVPMNGGTLLLIGAAVLAVMLIKD